MGRLDGKVVLITGAARGQGRAQAVRIAEEGGHVIAVDICADIASNGYPAERLATRTTNPYGKDPAELAEALQYQQTVEPLLRASATLEVVTTVPVARVADIVLDHVLGQNHLSNLD